MTANQLVAHNLRRAREARGWTQAIAARELEPYLGREWSVASFSAAERSAEGGRRRVFSANELLAFACAFNKPIAWFFAPPPELEDVYAGEPIDVRRVISRSQLLDATAGRNLWTDVVLREQIANLRDALEALEKLQREAGESVEPASIGTVGIGRWEADEDDDNEPREEESDA